MEQKKIHHTPSQMKSMKPSISSYFMQSALPVECINRHRIYSIALWRTPRTKRTMQKLDWGGIGPFDTVHVFPR